MPTSIDLDDMQSKELARLAEREKEPIELIVRQAIEIFLAQQREADNGHGKAFAAGFGLWGEGENGLTYQERLRKEW